MKNLSPYVLNKLSLDMCRRSLAAAVGFSIVFFVVLLFPIVTSPSFYPWHQMAASLALINSLLRFYWAKRIIPLEEEGLRKYGLYHSVAIVISTFFLSVLCCLSFLDTQNPDVKIFVTSFIIAAVMAGSTSSIALAPRIQKFFLLSVGVLPGIALSLVSHRGELPYVLWSIFIFTFVLYVYGNSKQFYSNMAVRYQTEEALSKERDNLTAAITKLEKAQEELLHQKARAEYAAKLAALGEMAGGIAHEINTPLNVILLLADQQLDLMNNDPLDKGALKESIQKVETTTQRIEKIVRGLRTFAREGEKDPFEVVALKDIIENTLALCHEKFKINNVDIRTSGPIEQIHLRCRPVQISQVLLNLLNNAFEAIQGLPEKWVALDVQQNNGVVEIRITDSGAGIPTEVQGDIFRPFFTTKEIGKGTGLGLSISRGLVEAHQGQMFYDPASSHTSFVIRLPAMAEQTVRGTL